MTTDNGERGVGVPNDRVKYDPDYSKPEPASEPPVPGEVPSNARDTSSPDGGSRSGERLTREQLVLGTQAGVYGAADEYAREALTLMDERDRWEKVAGQHQADALRLEDERNEARAVLCDHHTDPDERGDGCPECRLENTLIQRDLSDRDRRTLRRERDEARAHAADFAAEAKQMRADAKYNLDARDGWEVDYNRVLVKLVELGGNDDDSTHEATIERRDTLRRENECLRELEEEMLRFRHTNLHTQAAFDKLDAMRSPPQVKVGDDPKEESDAKRQEPDKSGE